MKRLLFLLFLLAASPGLHAQGYKAPDVVISNEKANIGGKVYYVHKVLPRQTLFSICKAYGLQSDDLAAANPDLKGGLKAGSILFIPADSARIPGLADSSGRKQEEVMPVPATANEEPEEETEEETAGPTVQRVFEHRVRWFESLRGIARKYGVSEKTIRDYNGLGDSESVRGKVLLIPVTEGDEKESRDENLSGILSEVGGAGEPGAPMLPVRRARWFSANDPLHIALVLPFNVKEGSASSVFLNFYSGALMAVREQKERGAHLILSVYDLSKGSDAILSDSRFRESDLIVGPVEAATLPPFLAFSDKKGIPLVSPLDHKADSLVDYHPFLFQVPASPTIQIENLVHSLRGRGDEPVLLVTSTATGENRLIEQMETLLHADGISYRKVGSSDLSGLLGSGMRKPARILIGSEDRAFTADVIRNLNTLSKKNIRMEVWCTNRVRNFETSDPDALFNLSVHTSAPYFVDYSDPRDQAFVLQYRALYFAEPDDFAFQGYDIFTCFISSMMQQGTAFIDNAEANPMQLLHCNFHFVRENEKSGWRNCATRNILFDKENFTVTLTR